MCSCDASPVRPHLAARIALRKLVARSKHTECADTVNAHAVCYASRPRNTCADGVIRPCFVLHCAGQPFSRCPHGRHNTLRTLHSSMMRGAAMRGATICWCLATRLPTNITRLLHHSMHTPIVCFACRAPQFYDSHKFDLRDAATRKHQPDRCAH